MSSCYSGRSSPPHTLVDETGESDPSAEIARLKRRLAASQEELVEATIGKRKKSPTTITQGRGICRIISLFESTSSLLDEDDHRQLEEDNGEEVDEAIKRTRDRTFTTFKLLIRLAPNLKKLMQESDLSPLHTYLTDLHEGAKAARSDDFKRIKEALASWVNIEYQADPPLQPSSRDGRGLSHNVCGELLCPIQFDWKDLQVRANICNMKDGFTLGNKYFITCLYPKDRANPQLLERNFLRGHLLVKVYCAIFTSPSSADAFEETEDGPVRKKQKTTGQKQATKGNVAQLLNMEGMVTARSIAYTAVQLVLNLTDAKQWTENYNGFNFMAFYNFIIDYFEVCRNAAKKKRVENLLAWWNRQVFPNHIVTPTELDESRDLLAAQEDRADYELDN